MRGILVFLRRHNFSFGKLIGLALIFLAVSVLSLVPPEVLRRATNAITALDPSALIGTLIFAGTTVLAFMAITYAKDMYQRGAMNYYQKMVAQKGLDKVIDTKTKILDKKQFGDISAVLIQTAESYAKALVGSVSQGSLGAFSLIVTFVYMCIIEWRLALCVLVYNVVIRIFAVFVERRIKQNAEDVTAALKKSGNFLSSLLRGMMTVKIYSNKDFLLNRLKNKEKAVMRANWKSFVWSNGFSDLIWAFSKLAEFVIVYGVGALLILQGTSDISILLNFVFTNDLFTIGVNNISFYLSYRAETLAYQGVISGILDETEIEDEGIVEINEKNFSVRFENVSFSYGDKNILRNVSFEIKSGEKVRLQGENGQGKSTVLKLISGLYRPSSGKIYYGNTCINDVHISKLTEKYDYISQHSNILEGSVHQNIALSKSVDENRAHQIMANLNLSGTESTSPKSLSMGEQQRLNIARALYKGERDIVLADEIFSNVDSDNRSDVITAFEKSLKDSTVVMITHEAVGYKFDKVLEVSAGKVMEVTA